MGREGQGRKRLLTSMWICMAAASLWRSLSVPSRAASRFSQVQSAMIVSVIDGIDRS